MPVTWWTVLAVVVVVTGAGAVTSCPAGCRCPVGPEEEVGCARGGGDGLTLRGQRGNYLNIICDGNKFSCEAMPRYDFGRNETVPSVGVKFCPVGVELSLACVVRAVGARGARRLTLDVVPGDAVLGPRLLDGLQDLEALTIAGDNTGNLSMSSLSLSALPSLRALTVRDTYLTLVAPPGSSPPPLPAALTYLELSCGLAALPPHLLAPLRRLRYLHLYNNKLRELHNDTLEGLSSLEELDVSSNELTSLSGAALRAAPLLSALSAFNNPLSELGPLAPMHHLGTLRIFNNRANLTLAPGALADLTNLTFVTLSRCSLRDLPEDLLSGSSALLRLDLAHNQLTGLPPRLFHDQHRLLELDLSGNQLASLPKEVFWKLTALTTLNLDGNKLVELPASLLDGLRSLHSLWASDNVLTSLRPAALTGAVTLRDLRLARNALAFPSLAGGEGEGDHHTQRPYANLENLSPFNSLVQLEHVDLSGNRLTAMFTDLPTVLLHLRLLNLSHNLIEEITASNNELNFLSANATVDLRHNRIASVQLPPAWPFPSPPPSPPLGRVLLGHNPLRCDCQLYAAARRLLGARPLGAEPALDVTAASCAAPPAQAGRPLAALALRDYLCELPPEQCVPGCACAVRPATAAVELRCSSPPATLPSPRDYGVRAVDVWLSSAPPSLAALPAVRFLSLAGLGLPALPADLPPVEELDLSNNSLSRIPWEVLGENTTVHVAGNPLACDCWHSADVAELQRRAARVADWAAARCAGGGGEGEGEEPARLEAGRLCAGVRAAAGGGALALLGLAVAVGAALLYRYSLEVRVFLYSRGCCRRLVCEEDLDKDKVYDAFLSFSHEDEAFVVGNLLPGLEAPPRPFRVCIHVRDWIPGEWIPAQIARSVDQSRRTIVVLSRNFLRSLWGRLEFRAANMSAVRERRSRVIVVLLEDVAGEEEVDAELRAYLATNTYLRWGDPWFWEKLRYALPHRRDEAAARRAGGKIVAKFLGLEGSRTARRDLTVMVQDGKRAGGKGGLDARLTPDGKIVNAAIKAAPAQAEPV